MIKRRWIGGLRWRNIFTQDVCKKGIRVLKRGGKRKGGGRGWGGVKKIGRVKRGLGSENGDQRVWVNSSCCRRRRRLKVWVCDGGGKLVWDLVAGEWGSFPEGYCPVFVDAGVAVQDP